MGESRILDTVCPRVRARDPVSHSPARALCVEAREERARHAGAPIATEDAIAGDLRRRDPGLGERAEIELCREIEPERAQGLEQAHRAGGLLPIIDEEVSRSLAVVAGVGLSTIDGSRAEEEPFFLPVNRPAQALGVSDLLCGRGDDAVEFLHEFLPIRSAVTG